MTSQLLTAIFFDEPAWMTSLINHITVWCLMYGMEDELSILNNSYVTTHLISNQNSSLIWGWKSLLCYRCSWGVVFGKCHMWLYFVKHLISERWVFQLQCEQVSCKADPHMVDLSFFISANFTTALKYADWRSLFKAKPALQKHEELYRPVRHLGTSFYKLTTIRSEWMMLIGP